MTVVGVTMVRDEADIIESTLRHMATQVDALIVADNRSVDGTTQILHRLCLELPVPMSVIQDDEVGYEQGRKMTLLAHRAHHMHQATWIVPFDADEIWYSSMRRIADFLKTRPRNEDVVPAHLYDHVCTGLDDRDEPDPVARILWRRNYFAPLPKVACRYSPTMEIGMGNHDVTYPAPQGRVSEHRLAIRHFPYRSTEQVIRKIRNGAEAYAATDLPEHFGAHWRQWGQLLDMYGPDMIEELFLKWYWRANPSISIDIDGEVAGPLRFDPAYDVATKR